MDLALYIHFPFCIKKCRYCDFSSGTYQKEMMRQYCNCLCREIQAKAAEYGDANITSVYLGGGTPSTVPIEMLEPVLKTLCQSFHFASDCEFTSEANPGTLHSEWLKCVTSYGLNRLSLGVQAVQDTLLQRIGRIHSLDDVLKAVDIAKAYNIDNLNCDLMYGLPGQTEADYLSSIQTVAGLAPKHISAYSLIVEEGTPLCADVVSGRESLPDEDTVCDMEEQGQALLESLGYHRYEISNYAKPGFQCVHNTSYWRDRWYLGIGTAAHSMLPVDLQHKDAFDSRMRIANTNDIMRYCTSVEAKNAPVHEQQLITGAEARFETMMLGLRMTQGVSDVHFQKIHCISLESCWGSVLDDLIGQELAEWSYDPDGQAAFRLTQRGLSLQNTVLQRFMPD